MTPEQSLVVLEMACYEDQFLDGNFHYSNHTDVEKIGLVLIANKTRYLSKHAGWQKLHGSTGGTRQKVWTRTKILSPNIRYFVAN